MSSKSSIRRSLRPRRSDKAPFQVGDVVEVSYRNGIEIGTLLCQVTTDRWIVKYKNNNMHEQQVSEKCFGQIICRSSDQSSESSAKPMRSQDTESKPRHIENASMEGSSTTQSSRKIKRGRQKNKAVNLLSETNMQESSSTGTGTMSSDGDSHLVTRSNIAAFGTGTRVIPNNDGKEPVLSAREKRMRLRREANGSGTEELQELGPKKKKRRTKTREGNSNKTESVKECNVSKSSSKKGREEVVKVKLNTGTLYLYRGMNPRAVFVRRY